MPVIKAKFLVILLTCLALHAPVTGLAAEESFAQSRKITAPDAVPDLREEEVPLKLQKRDFMIVPIPVSNPTLDTGLILGGAYFYKQTEAQKKVQPASMTGAMAFYTSNESAAFGVGHQSYWNENKWRLGAALGHMDLKLDLVPTGAGSSGPNTLWRLNGNFVGARLSRKIVGKWYAGLLMRHIDIDQSFEFDMPTSRYSTDNSTISTSGGVIAEYDSRDLPTNPYTGAIFEIDALTSELSGGSNGSYQSYSLSYRSYHTLVAKLVLAWEVQGCKRSGETPLWDACRIDLRGFSSTDYLGNASASAQVEARWHFHKKWGAVAFAGGGYHKNSFSNIRDQDLIHSYGIGLRFMVLESKRINMRLDYGRSNDSDAIYLSVGEAF